MVARAGLGRLRRGVFAAAALALAVAAAQAKDADAIMADQAARQAEYEKVSQDMTLSAARLEQLSADIAKVRKDHATITAALIQSAKTE